jgi:hypothetical protein
MAIWGAVSRGTVSANYEGGSVMGRGATFVGTLVVVTLSAAACSTAAPHASSTKPPVARPTTTASSSLPSVTPSPSPLHWGDLKFCAGTTTKHPKGSRVTVDLIGDNGVVADGVETDVPRAFGMHFVWPEGAKTMTVSYAGASVMTFPKGATGHGSVGSGC